MRKQSRKLGSLKKLFSRNRNRKAAVARLSRAGCELLEERRLLAVDFYGPVYMESTAAATGSAETTMLVAQQSTLLDAGTGVLDGGQVGPWTPPEPEPFDGSAEMWGRQLRIDGTDAADSIVIDEYTDGSGVSLVRVTMSDAQGDVRLIKFFARSLVDLIDADGKAGSDTIVNNTSIPSRLQGGDHQDTLVGGSAGDELLGGSGHDNLEGRGGDDILKGEQGDDTYRFADGYLGHDEIDSVDGTNALSSNRDTLDFSGFRGPVVAYSFITQTSIRYGVTFDLDLYSPQQVNSQLLLTVDAHRELADSGTAIRDIIGTNYDDNISGNAGHNRIDGLGGDDALIGRRGNDVLNGGYGEDVIDGGVGDDILNGGPDDDVLKGDLGDDVYVFQGSQALGVDTILEQTGADTFDFSGLAQAVNINLGRSGQFDVNSLITLDLTGSFKAVENVIGTSFSDIILGNELDNRLQGRGGNDVIYAYAGNDGLFGGPGYDWLDAGSGNDGLYTGIGGGRAYGRAGADRFHVHRDYNASDVTDRGSSDVRINYRNGGSKRFDNFSTSTVYLPGYWAESDVERVDQALDKLQRATNNTTLLKMPSGGEYTMIRLGGLSFGTAVNGVHVGSSIYLTENAFQSLSDFTQRTVIHEIGHSWDDPASNPLFTQFLAMSGWTDQRPSASELDDYEQSADKDWWYLKGSDFVSQYAKTNPREDFAETVEAYFARLYDLDQTSLRYDLTADKLDLVEDWVDSLSTPAFISYSYFSTSNQLFASYSL